METSASVTTTEKEDAKSGSLEGTAFPDPGRKASALAVATAVAAHGGTLCSACLAGSRGVFH